MSKKSHQTTIYFKTAEKPNWIDLILTNRPQSFQSSFVIETGLSYFHRILVLEVKFRRLPAKLITYRDFKKFDNERFINCLQSVLSDPHADWNIRNPDIFFQIRQKVLDDHAPQTKKYICGNHKSFMSKRLSKATMQKARFRNKFLKNPTNENRYFYTKKRNLSASVSRKEKKITLQTLMKRISPIIENFCILLNHFFLKKINQVKVFC